jgi:hypothetical protein
VFHTLQPPCDLLGANGKMGPTEGPTDQLELPLGNLSKNAVVLLYLFYSYMLQVMLNGVFIINDNKDPMASPFLHGW